MAKKKLAEAGYGGEPIVVIAPTELTGIRALSLIGAEQMRRAGLNVDRQEMEFGTVVKRRTSQSPPDKGGWNVFFTMIDRSIPNIHPFGNPALRADGKAAFDGGSLVHVLVGLAAIGRRIRISPSANAFRRKMYRDCRILGGHGPTSSKAQDRPSRHRVSGAVMEPSDR